MKPSVICNHILSGDRPVKLICNFEHEWQYSCGCDDHNDYDSFKDKIFFETLLFKSLRLNLPKVRVGQFAELVGSE